MCQIFGIKCTRHITAPIAIEALLLNFYRGYWQSSDFCPKYVAWFNMISESSEITWLFFFFFCLYQNALKYCQWVAMWIKKKNMMGSDWSDQQSHNVFSHSKQLLCAIAAPANSCLIIYCHSQGRGQQPEFGAIQISWFRQLKQPRPLFCTACLTCSLLGLWRKMKSEIGLLYIWTGLLFFSLNQKVRMS